MRKLVLCLFILTLVTISGEAQIFHRDPEKKLFAARHVSNKTTKVHEPKAVVSAKKKQAASNKKQKKDDAESAKRTQKRTYDIQTPDVQARMKQNRKDATARDKEKKRKTRSGTKKAGKKYK